MVTFLSELGMPREDFSLRNEGTEGHRKQKKGYKKENQIAKEKMDCMKRKGSTDSLDQHTKTNEYIYI